MSPLGAMAEDTAAPKGFEDWTPYVDDGTYEGIWNNNPSKSTWTGAFADGTADAEGMIFHAWDEKTSGMIYSKESYTDFEMSFDYHVDYGWTPFYVGIGASNQGNTFNNQETGLYSLMIGDKGNVRLNYKKSDGNISDANWISSDIEDSDSFRSSKHSIKIRVVNKKMTVYISKNADGDWNERGTVDLPEYNGGYVYLSSSAPDCRFSAPVVVELSSSQPSVADAFSNFTPYNVECGDGYFGGTSTKMDNYDLWNASNKDGQESLMTSCKWQDGAKAG